MSLLPTLGLHRTAPTGSTPPSDPKNAQRGDTAKNAAEEQAAVGAALLDTLPEGPDRDTIDEILKQHKKLVKPESAVFNGYPSLDALAHEPNPDKRDAKTQEIARVIAAVDGRRKALHGAIAALRPGLTPLQLPALNPAMVTLSTIDSHLPDEFNGRLVTPQALRARIETMTKTPEEKRQILAQAKRGFFDENGDDITESFGEKFKDTIEPVGTKGFERLSFYFDEFIAEPPRDKLEEIYKLSDRIVAQGQQILDCGGKLRDVEALIKRTGVPETWWPPRFVETLQAWRKTERALAEERVGEMMKKEKAKFDPASIVSVVDFLMEMVPDGMSEASDLAKNSQVLAAAKQFTDGMQNGYGVGAIGLEALQTGDFSKVPPNKVGIMSRGLEASLNMMEAAITTASSVAGIADSAGASFAATFIPGLSIAASGVKLATALKHLAEHSGHAIQTRLMRGDATAALGSGSMEDGGAFLNALENELSGRHKQIAKDSIEVTVSGMELAGSIAETAGAHYGMAASLVLKITGKTISFGSKVVFTNIDWSEANRAKALLKEAQAGNPIARMAIFEHSNLYAKMYICVLCKEGNSLAHKFVAQRGIEEEDLNTAMSMKILREALMDSADQKDENDIEDNLFLENTGKLGKAALKMGGKIAKIKDLARGSRSIPYLADWIYNGAIAITDASFSGARKQALAAGLYDDGDETGIGGKVKTAEKRLVEAATMMQSSTDSTSKDQKKKVLAIVEALDALSAAIMGSSPLTNPQGDGKKVEDHKGFTLYLAKLASMTREERLKVEKFMRSDGFKDVEFAPTIGANVLSAADFKRNWAGAVDAACMPDEDGGLQGALKNSESASEKLGKATEQQKRRAATLDLEDALNEVIGGVKSAWSSVAEVKAMQGYLQQISAEAAKQRRAADESLAGGVNWPNAPAVPQPAAVTVAAWETMWKAACDGGFCTKKSGDGGVKEAVSGLIEANLAIRTAAIGKPKLAARRNLAKAVGKVIVARNTFRTVQRDPASQVLTFVENIYKRALLDQKREALQATLTLFTPVEGIAAAAWMQSYDNAVDNGALPKAAGAFKALDGALKDFASTKAKFTAAVQGGEFKEALLKGTELKADIDAALTAIDSKVMGAEGYAEHGIMGPYLKRVRATVKAEHDQADLKRALAGDIGDLKFMASGFTLVAADFSRVKENAIEAGVIAEIKTGVSGALKAYTKSSGKANAAPTDAALQKVAASDANALLVAVSRLAGLSANAQWQSFARTAVTVAKAEVDRLAPLARAA
jgi:hypothetical protein